MLYEVITGVTNVTLKEIIMQHEKLIKNSALIKTINSEVIQVHVNSGKFRFVSYSKDSVIHFENEPCTIV